MPAPDPMAQASQSPASGRRAVSVGAACAAIWLLLSLMAYVLLPHPEPRTALGLWAWIAGTLVPVGLIALGTGLAHQKQILRAEADQLRSDLNALKAQMRAPDEDALPEAGTETETERPWHDPLQPQDAPATEAQGTLPLGPNSTPTHPLSPEDLVRALHFPETPDDRAGLRALSRARKDPRLSPLIEAAQDMLTLLSQDGIYTDDLPPDRARPELWRRFASGERDPSLAALGGIRDATALDVCTARLHDNTVFRDAAHHFLRRFDRMLADVEPDLTDAEIVALTDTRSARAFMVVGRAAGIFDRG